MPRGPKGEKRPADVIGTRSTSYGSRSMRAFRNVIVLGCCLAVSVAVLGLFAGILQFMLPISAVETRDNPQGVV